MTDTRKQISYRLIDAVKASGFTYRQLAEETEISTNTINAYLNKGAMPGADKLAMLCTVLGVSADRILGTEGMTREDMAKQHEQVVFRAAVERFGFDWQAGKFCEEMAELLEAVCRERQGRDTVSHVAEEIADVEIMLEQLKVWYKAHGMVEGFRRQKTERLAEKIVKREGSTDGFGA